MNKTVMYGFLGLSFILMKLWYRTASVESLAFILRPISQVVEWIMGQSAIHIANEGFLFGDLNIIISKSCSGFNFFLTCLLMLVVLLIINLHLIKKKLSAGLIFLVITYVVTLTANCSRIITALHLKPYSQSLFPDDLVHAAIGIVTYCSFLIATYFLVEKIIIKKLTYADATPS